MNIGMIGAFVRNYPFATELAFKKGLEDIDVNVYCLDPSSNLEDDIETWKDLDAIIIFKNAGIFKERVKKLREKTKVIVYQPDDVRAPGIENMLKETLEYCDFAFTFDDRGADYCDKIGYRGSKELLVCANSDLYKPLNLEKEIDVCFVGNFSNSQMHASRQKMYKTLYREGYNVVVVTDFNPHTVNEIYNKTRVVLNHATDVGQPFGSGYGYQCRHFEVASSGACLLSNSIIGKQHLKELNTFDSEESLVETLELLLNLNYGDKLLYEACADSLHNEVMINHNEKIRAHEICKTIEGWS